MTLSLRDRRTFCHAAIFIIIASISTPSRGDTIDVDKIDWQFLDVLGDFQTSKCIGDPKTPFCAAETYYACNYRQEKSLCTAVNAPFSRRELRTKSPIFRNSIYAYGEINRMTLKKQDIPKNYYKWWGRILRVGDVAIRAIRHTCLPDLDCVEANKSSPGKGRMCRTTSNCHIYKFLDTVIVLRPTSSGWMIGGEYLDSEFPKLYPETESPPRISSFTLK